MQLCLGTCTRIPDEVSLAVLDSLQIIPEGGSDPDAGDARAVVVALRMAREGWRFCPCFAEAATPQHARVSGLVETNFANRLADSAQLETAVRAKKLRAA
jgi:hypothetical protein